MVLMRVKGELSDLWLLTYQPLSVTKGIDRCRSLQWPVIDINNHVEMKKPAKSLRCNRNSWWRGHWVHTYSKKLEQVDCFGFVFKNKILLMLTPLDCCTVEIVCVNVCVCLHAFVFLCEDQISSQSQEDGDWLVGWGFELFLVLINITHQNPAQVLVIDLGDPLGLWFLKVKQCRPLRSLVCLCLPVLIS